MKRRMKALGFLTLIFWTVTGAAQTPGSCTTFANVMNFLRYGNCREFQFHKGRVGRADLCSDTAKLLNARPEQVVSAILREASDSEALTAILNCRHMRPYINWGIDHKAPDGATLLHGYALSCNRSRIILAKSLGAKGVKDRKGRTPEQVLSDKIANLQLAVQLESDATKATDLQKKLTKCQDALGALSGPYVSLDQLKSLKIPLQSKMALARFGRTDGALAPDPSITRQTASTGQGISK